MKWFFRIVKVSLIMLIAAFSVQLAFIYFPNIKSVKFLKSQVNKVTVLFDIPKDSINKPLPNKEREQEAPDSKDFLLSFDEISSLENISLKDKLSALAVISKIPGNQLEKIKDIVLDGVVEAEISELRDILEKNLSEKDVSMLEEIVTRNKALFASARVVR